jgi:hypothetical protein
VPYLKTLYCHLPAETEENHKNTVSIISNLAKIQTKYSFTRWNVLHENHNYYDGFHFSTTKLVAIHNI